MAICYPVTAFVHEDGRQATVLVSHPPDDLPEDLRKAASIPPGARWLTVHPNGKGSPGQPVLIQETSPGSGVHHVIGGAGGKLNYLKLRGVKDPGTYHKEAAERRKAKAEGRKAQRTQEKEAGTYQAKQEARKAVDSERRSKERAFIDHVADTMGWNGHRFDSEAHPDLSDRALNAARSQHHREWLARAHEAVNHNKKVLLHDAEARARALGEDPLEAGDDPLDVSDIGLQPTRKAQLGMSVDFAKEAEKHGSTREDIAAEAKATAPRPDEAAVKRNVTSEAIAQELAAFRSGAEDAPVKHPSMDQPADSDGKGADGQASKELPVKEIMGLVKAQKDLAAARKAAAEAKRAIDTDNEVKGAYNLHVSDAGMDEVRDGLLNDLRTASTRSFLSEVGERYGGDHEKALGVEMTEGAYGAINALSVAVAGSGIMDRMVVDVLGIGDSAKILARKLRSELPAGELDDLKGVLEAYHTDHYLKATESALEEAREAEAEARSIDVDSADTGQDLDALKALNDRRAESARKARRLLGRTLGEMEANAALVAAFQSGKGSDELSIPIGRMDRVAAITRARALGLDPVDYEVHSLGQDQYLKIGASAQDKLVRPIDREELQRYRESKAILNGERDETGWLPEGLARRPDLAVDELQPGVAPQLAEPFAPGPDLGQSIRDYIGGRTADGDAPADIVADLHSQAIADKAGDPSAYWKALDDIVPRNDAKGRPIVADGHRAQFEAMADDFVKRGYGSERAPLHRQHIESNEQALDALHRALAEVPEGAAAYKPVGDLTHAERRGLRQWWTKNVGAKDARGAELAEQLDAIEAREPPKTAPSMFGDDDPNPAWGEWKRERDGKAAEVHEAGLSWPRYVEGMGGSEAAIVSTQDLVRSQLSSKFAEHHNRLNPNAPLKVGRESIRGGLNHLDMIDPKARAERQRKQRELIDVLRERDQGKYAGGRVVDKLSAAAERAEAMEQGQVDIFGFAQPDETPASKPLKGDQRHTLGHAAERQLAGLMQYVGANFRSGDKIKLWQPSMDGKYILGQRAVKYIEANKRVALGLGTGTGKTVIGLGSFTHLHSQGKANKGLFVVPSSVQGQFHGEALRYLEPGKYKWHAKPGASRDERLSAMRDPENHFSVVTHQALRDDLLHLGAKAAGIDKAEMADKLSGMSVAERKAWAGKVMAGAGINADFVMLDEAHGTLNRQGKENSALANVLDAVGYNAAYQVLASADPVKNDASEVADLMAKLNPEKYGDRDRFLRRYGGDTPEKRDALRQEMTPYLMAGRTDPGVPVTRSERKVALNASQQTAIKRIQDHMAKVRLGRIKGEPAIESLKALSPGAFEGVPEDRHKAVAEQLQRSVGVLKESAMRRAIDDMGQSAKLDEVAKVAAERRGKPGVVFAHSLEVAKDLKERLAADGHRVALLTGEHSAAERDAIRQGFHPESGDPTHDILVMSDAGAVGINAQRGQWLAQYDTPVTSMSHAQRQGRIHRLGQKSGVELIDLVGDHPHEQRARKRLREKYALRETLTDPSAGLDDTGIAGYLAHRKMENEAGQGGLF